MCYNFEIQIIKLSGLSWHKAQGYNKKILLDKIGKKGIVIQQVKIKSGETAKTHYYKKQTEVFYFLNSNGYWNVNGKKTKVKKREILVIEPFDRHEVVNNTSNDYLYLAFKYNYDSEDICWE